MSRYMGKNVRRKSHNKLIFAVIAIALLAFAGFCVAKMMEKHVFDKKFYAGTVIQGRNVSEMTAEEAKEAVLTTFANSKVILKFLDNAETDEVLDKVTREFLVSELGVSLKDVDEISRILEEQHAGNNQVAERNYDLELSIDSEILKNALSGIPELQEEKMKLPSDAYVTRNDDGTFSIVYGSKGAKIDFDEAMEFCRNKLLSGENTINFESVTKTEPEIAEPPEEVVQNIQTINRTLCVSVRYVLPDGYVYCLDKEITKNWVSEENGEYTIDVETGIEEFLQVLDKKVQEYSATITVGATGLSEEIPFSISYTREIDYEQEFQRLEAEFLMPGITDTREPIYKKVDLTSYIEIDITRQMVWMYLDGECVVTTPCVSGRASKHDTPTGVYYLTYKTTDTYLKGNNDDGTKYNVHVNYWMPFNGGVGLHDALWRGTFGREIYKTNGSHGCVNLPLDAAKTIYTYIDKTMPIIVYKS